MGRRPGIALLLILLGAGFSVLWGSYLARSTSGGMADFKAVYYGARCLMQHTDPYQDNQLLQAYEADGRRIPADPILAMLYRRAVLVCINLPTTLFLIIPFALLHLELAYALWLLIMAAGLTLAAFLIWQQTATTSPGIALSLICFLLANCVILFKDGNAAGIVVALSVIAVWCFLQDRFVGAGILLLALGLAIKPHDAGLIWLYFLLAGGLLRKRALQTLAVTVVLALPAVLWVSHVAPHWLPELRSNLQTASSHGGLNDPGPVSLGFHHPDPIIDLQALLSIFRDDPRFYTLTGYLISGVLLVLWAVATLRSRQSPKGAWLALAAVSALTMLVTYHRQHDAKLLMLAIPACAMLCAEGGRKGWFALLATSTGIVLTGDVPATFLSMFTVHMSVEPGLIGRLKSVLLFEPAPLVLLVIATFFIWVYWQEASLEFAAVKRQSIASPSSV